MTVNILSDLLIFLNITQSSPFTNCSGKNQSLMHLILIKCIKDYAKKKGAAMQMLYKVHNLTEKLNKYLLCGKFLSNPFIQIGL